MKNFTLCVFMAMIALTSTAQITITEADYSLNLQGDTTNISSIDFSGGIAVPQAGTDVIWDYSNLSFDMDYTYLTTPGSNSLIPSGNIREDDYFLVLGVSLPAVNYYRYDSTGFSVVGYTHIGADLPLGSITGNSFDSLSVKYSASEYTPPISLIKFPCNYGDSMVNRGVQHHQYVANVAAFGLVDYEVNQEKITMSEYHVHGWGQLVLNNDNTMQNDTFGVLLRQRITTVIDSFFDAAGNQVPDVVLNAFGYIQGQSLIVERNTFYAKGLNFYALNINTVDGDVVAANLNRDIFQTPTVGTKATKLNHIVHAVFPNPVQNHRFQIQFEKTSPKDWQFEMVNIVGQKVHQETFSEGKSTIQTTIQLNNDLPKGAYFYAIRNEDGQVIANGRIIL